VTIGPLAMDWRWVARQHGGARGEVVALNRREEGEGCCPGLARPRGPHRASGWLG
jgi:hypothetical protein